MEGPVGLFAALDSNWLSVAVIATITILGHARWKRVQSLSLEARPVFVKTVLIALLAVGGIAVFRSTPLFDPPLSESQGKVSKIWMDVQDLRRCGVSTSDWDAFAKKSLPALTEISHELDECLSRQGPWSLMMGHDRPTELARLDLIGIARHDLPAIIRAGTSGNDVRDHSVTLRLDRVEDHLAGLSSYVVMPRAKAEIPGSLVSINGMLLCCGVAAGVILIALICLRRVRRRRLRIDSVYAMSSR